LFNGGTAFWMKNEMRRARLHRKIGRQEEAQRIEDKLERLLAVADPDFPLLNELHEEQRLSAAR
jgi:hypothetical protein